VTSTANTRIGGSGFLLFGLLNNGLLLGSLDDDYTPRVWDIADPYHPGNSVQLRNDRPQDPARPRSSGGEIGDFGDDQLMHVDFNRGITIWDVTDPNRPVKKREIPVPASRVELIHDSRLLATWDDARHTLSFWNTGDMREPLTTFVADSFLAYLYVSPDDHTLAAEVEDPDRGRGIRLWEMDPERLYRYLCASADSTITPEEWARHIPNRPYERPC
jgi:hypothetical protein